MNGLVVGSVPTTGDFERDAVAVQRFLKARGLWKPISQGQAIFGQAVAFANAAALLHKQSGKPGTGRGANPSPFIVNSAFAIELYLKALAALNGKTLKGHDLLSLHAMLPAEAKLAIDASLEPAAKNRNLGEPPAFEKYISELRKAFVAWRYCYELERAAAVKIEPTIFVMEVLHRACRSYQDV